MGIKVYRLAQTDLHKYILYQYKVMRYWYTINSTIPGTYNMYHEVPEGKM